PQAAVLESVAACVERRIGGAVIFASGFSEAGEEGRAKQSELAATAREGGLAIDGPNCLGFVNYLERVPLTFDHADPDLVSGSGVALIGQSGAMIGVIRGGLAARGIPMAFAISTGNEAVTSAEDFLAELVDDERIRMVVLFIEQIRRPRLFLELVARARVQGKPVVMMHPGRTARAQASAQSHTGALAGDYAVMRTVLQHHAVVVVDKLDELFDVAALLARWPDPPTLGAAVVTNSGAFRGVALDFSEEVDLDFPALQPATCDVIKAWFPPFAGVGNPLDIMTLGFTKPDIFGQASKALLDDPGIGSLIASFVAGAPNLHTPKSKSMLPVITASKKPVAFVMMGDEQPLTDEFRSAVRASGVPLFRSPERAMRAMASITRYGRSLQALKEARPEPAVPPVSLREGGPVPEYRGKSHLAAAGISVPAGALARSAGEAQDIAARIGYPVVLKAQAAALTHKSDVGGVIVNIVDAAALDAAWNRLHADIGRARPELALDGVLVERMAKPGLELVVG
ncbi:MAG: CoA-binding protein, partial [Betaproteobacteria bacterium RBG_16_64_9]